MKTKYTLFSLFTGAGGLDLGFELTDKYDVLFGNDISLPATQTYARNFKVKHVMVQPRSSDLPVVFLGDVSKLAFDGFEHIKPTVVAGGPPCQDFSIVRGPHAERGGIDVSRGRLYSHFVRALIHLQPSVFVFENVPGLKSANEGQAYVAILEDFSSLRVRWDDIKKLVGNDSKIKPKDYDIIFAGLVDASKLGVPQARRRVIVIGLRKDLSKSIWWKIEALKRKAANHLYGDTLLSKYPLTPIEVFEGRPLQELEASYVKVMEDYRGVPEEVGTKKALEWKRTVWEKLTFNVKEDYIRTNRINAESQEELNKALEEHAVLLKKLNYSSAKVSELKSPDGSNLIPGESKSILDRMERIPPGENHEFVRGTEWQVEGRGISLIYKRIHPLKPAYTVVAYGGGGTWGYHYEKLRGMLTNRERARLQTFPDSFFFQGGLSQVRAQLGEAVPPLMAKKIAEIVADILEDFT